MTKAERGHPTGRANSIQLSATVLCNIYPGSRTCFCITSPSHLVAATLSYLNTPLAAMVDTSSAVRRGHPIAFGLFTFVAFIVAVIATTLVADYNSNHNPPTSGINNATRFLVFAGWWGFVVGVAYVSRDRVRASDTQVTDLLCFSRPLCSSSALEALLLRSPVTPSLFSSHGSSGWPVPLP